MVGFVSANVIRACFAVQDVCVSEAQPFSRTKVVLL